MTFFGKTLRSGQNLPIYDLKSRTNKRQTIYWKKMYHLTFSKVFMRQKTVVYWVGVGNQRLMVGVRFPLLG